MEARPLMQRDVEINVICVEPSLLQHYALLWQKVNRNIVDIFSPFFLSLYRTCTIFYIATNEHFLISKAPLLPSKALHALRLRLHEIRTGDDPRSAPVLPRVYTGLSLGRAFASRMFCRSCNASITRSSNRTHINIPLDVNKAFGSTLDVYTRIRINRYQSAPLRILLDVMAIVTTRVR